MKIFRHFYQIVDSDGNILFQADDFVTAYRQMEKYSDLEGPYYLRWVVDYDET